MCFSCSQRTGPQAPVDLLSLQTHSFFLLPVCLLQGFLIRVVMTRLFKSMRRREILVLQRHVGQEVWFYQSQCLRGWRWGERAFRRCGGMKFMDGESLGTEYRTSNKWRHSSGAVEGLQMEWLKWEGLGKIVDWKVYASGYSNHLTFKWITVVFHFDQLLWKNTSLEFGGDGQVRDSDERLLRQGEE